MPLSFTDNYDDSGDFFPGLSAVASTFLLTVKEIFYSTLMVYLVLHQDPIQHCSLHAHYYVLLYYKGVSKNCRHSLKGDNLAHNKITEKIKTHMNLKKIEIF